MAACYELAVKAQPGKRSAHVARLEVRYCPVIIKRPRQGTDKGAPAQLSLFALEVCERPETVVGREKPIHWRLLTTHKLDSMADVFRCIDWYCQRWHIEQLFRTLKKQGLNLEESQVESAKGLVKLTSLATQAAVRTMQLTLAREERTNHPANEVFEPEEIQVLERLQPQLEGRTALQKNPHPVGGLAWAAWLIARLGGWKGYRSEAKPGPITMLRGQMYLSDIVKGWRLANMCID